ncbi:monovalent cation:proton antiporter-2 (CPA2) family protein [Kangiella sediminilitoris]|uniref:Potassium transporter n=1 Tax=Kangiella sediminilitoris TaxID=1144748 RepID=A0A1B3B9R6_9GAMM|nr:monovalent cation:proton antiporter-2 (CPA2) family protein [Kangiella sediminilitoris]AOE49550.1 potassium transporter [Kangiella sediminilitoris]
MEESTLLHQVFVFLFAAVVGVPIAKHIGLGSVLGYLIAGILIGPFALGLVGQDVKDIMHFAEFGVVMMLFLIGLELQPKKLWKLRMPILGLGGLQVILSTILITAIAYLFELSWQMSLAIGLILALSSTAIVLQTLSEKDLLRTDAGKSAFSVLLFQDIAVIPMLTLMPLLATLPVETTTAIGHVELEAWQQAALVFVVISGIIIIGRYLVRPLFNWIARTGLREIFIATSLLLVITITIAMQMVGLSPALGAFLAGVVLAESEYRHELEVGLVTFKSLLLGLFFITVGASINLEILMQSPGLIALLLVILIVVKIAVLMLLAKQFKMSLIENMLFSFALAQGGEFAFVLFSFASLNGVLSNEIISILTVVVALSMALTPLLLIFCEKLIIPRLSYEKEKRTYDHVDDGETPVIVAGYGRFGQIVSRILRSQGFDTTLLEYDAVQIDLVKRFGTKAYYGDVTNEEVLRVAGADAAKMIVIAVGNQEKTLKVIELCRKHFPHLKIFSRAKGRREAYEQKKAGANFVMRETLGSAVILGREALVALGYRKYQAHRTATAFYHYDSQHLEELADLWGDDKQYVMEAAERAEMLEAVLKADQADSSAMSRSWSSPVSLDDDEETKNNSDKSEQSKGTTET